MEITPFDPDDSPGWKRRSDVQLFKHPYIGVREVAYESPNRDTPVTWIIAERKAGVCVAPQLPDGRFLMIQQERYPIQRVLWEFPAGQIDDPNWRENPQAIEDTALRELREETGHELDSSGEMIHLGHFFASQGFTDEHVYLFVAKTVIPTVEGRMPDPGENILDCRPFTADEIRQRIAENEIVDANSLSLFAKLCALGMFG